LKKVQTLTIVGVGLIGGSIGLAARRYGVAGRILGTSRRPASLERARALGIIDEGFVDFAEAVRQADLSVFCTPVDQIANQVLTAAAGCPAGALLTDAGSTKAGIVHAVETRMAAGVAFVGSHPLAGSEKRGFEYADADLFQGRLTVVTRTAHTDPRALERTTAFWEALGSRVHLMDPEEHDRALALTSHVPHLVAAALAGLLQPELQHLTATGFRDTTRVAAGDPSIWTGIFEENRSAVVEALRQFDESVNRFRRALMDGDTAALDSLLSNAKKVRDALGN
jgi:prephenate dehydrogenase